MMEQGHTHWFAMLVAAGLPRGGAALPRQTRLVAPACLAGASAARLGRLPGLPGLLGTRAARGPRRQSALTRLGAEQAPEGGASFASLSEPSARCRGLRVRSCACGFRLAALPAALPCAPPRKQGRKLCGYLAAGAFLCAQALSACASAGVV